MQNVTLSEVQTIENFWEKGGWNGLARRTGKWRWMKLMGEVEKRTVMGLWHTRKYLEKWRKTEWPGLRENREQEKETVVRNGKGDLQGKSLSWNKKEKTNHANALGSVKSFGQIEQKPMCQLCYNKLPWFSQIFYVSSISMFVWNLMKKLKINEFMKFSLFLIP